MLANGTNINIEVIRKLTIRLKYLGIAVSLIGGTRMVGVNDDVVLDAITWDPNEPEKAYNTDS